MATSFKPAGYPSLSPYIMVNDAERTIKFLQDAFGATQHRRMERPDGHISHVEMRIDDSVVMLSQGTDDYPAFPVWLHLYVPDVDATYARALEAGGTSAQEPTRKDDPDRRGGVVDPSGNTWWVSTQQE